MQLENKYRVTIKECYSFEIDQYLNVVNVVCSVPGMSAALCTVTFHRMLSSFKIHNHKCKQAKPKKGVIVNGEFDFHTK